MKQKKEIKNKIENIIKCYKIKMIFFIMFELIFMLFSSIMLSILPSIQEYTNKLVFRLYFIIFNFGWYYLSIIVYFFFIL